ncbi:MAG: phosphatidylcholine synthase [Hyphomicrobiaceae bacterium]|nr:phosphatidylcholine synthase [Hyphomicrobiaceae bacterium]
MKLAAIAVHLLTGLGALCALLAAEAVSAGAFERTFFWLGVAFIVDGIDGPIARAVGVERRLPRFSGERIDLVIDYLTYVFVPVLALLAAVRLGDAPWAYGLAAMMLLTSLFHFSDTESKARELAFVGFPAIWNIVAFYVFALDLGALSAAVLIVVCSAMTFVPLHWVHPVRVVPLRPVTLAVTALWFAAAAWTIAHGFPGGSMVDAVLVGCALYGIAVTLWLTWRGVR